MNALATNNGLRALVVPSRTRASAVRQLQESARANRTPTCTIIRGRGRRRGAAEDLVAKLVGSGIETVVLPSISVLHPSVSRALSVASALLSSGLKVVSLAEAWLTTADPSTLMAIASLLRSEEQRASTRRGASVVLALARRGPGAKVGRPAKPLAIPPEEASRLVTELGWRRAARRIGSCSPATLRRHLLRAGVSLPRRAA